MKNLSQLAALVAITSSALLCIGCSRPGKAEAVLSANGYTDIEITGWAPFMKGEDDTFSTGFRAKSPSGQTVEGAVTGGWLKGSTIRLK